MLLQEKLFSRKRLSWTVASVLVMGLALITSGASASPLGTNYDVAWVDFGVIGGGDVSQTVTFDESAKTVGDTTLSERVRTLADGREVIEFNISAKDPLVGLSSNLNSNFRVGFENITWGKDGGVAVIDNLFFGFSDGGVYLAPGDTGSTFPSVHPIDGHAVLEIEGFVPSIGGPADSVGMSSGGFAFFEGLLSIFAGAGFADVDGLQIGMVVSHQPVPEPGTALLLGLGLAGLAGARRRE